MPEGLKSTGEEVKGRQGAVPEFVLGVAVPHVALLSRGHIAALDGRNDIGLLDWWRKTRLIFSFKGNNLMHSGGTQ